MFKGLSGFFVAQAIRIAIVAQSDHSFQYIGAICRELAGPPRRVAACIIV